MRGLMALFRVQIENNAVIHVQELRFSSTSHGEGKVAVCDAIIVATDLIAMSHGFVLDT